MISPAHYVALAVILFVIGGVGSASIDASGPVTGLTKAEDLNGDYTSLAGGGAFGAGAGKVIVGILSSDSGNREGREAD